METRTDTTANWENDLELLRSGSIRKYKTKDQPTHRLAELFRPIFIENHHGTNNDTLKCAGDEFDFDDGALVMSLIQTT